MIEKATLMPLEEAEKWLDCISKDDLLQILREYRVLRNGICERTLGVATGAENWLSRAIARSYYLRQVETVLRRMTAQLESEVISSKLALQNMDCSNCSGLGCTGMPEHHSTCSICKGTGRRFYDQ